MSPLTKIGAFAAALAAAFGAAYGIGAVAAPVDSGPEKTAHASAAGEDEHGGHADEGTAATAAAAAPAGLQVSEDGYTLDLATTAVAADRPSTLRFVIRDEHGAPVTSYRTDHGAQLHLILASRELTTYRHLHPTRAADGTWSTPVALPAPGAYRVFADFTPAGADRDLTLGADLAVTGAYRSAPLPRAASTTTVDGYTVRLDGRLTGGSESELTFTVTRAGRPVALQPYLGARGHLVALRSGDLAYLHVHPHEDALAFTARVPSTGTYRLFLDFKVDGTVHTAAFTAVADGPGEGHGH